VALTYGGAECCELNVPLTHTHTNTHQCTSCRPPHRHTHTHTHTRHSDARFSCLYCKLSSSERKDCIVWDEDEEEWTVPEYGISRTCGDPVHPKLQPRPSLFSWIPRHHWVVDLLLHGLVRVGDQFTKHLFGGSRGLLELEREGPSRESTSSSSPLPYHHTHTHTHTRTHTHQPPTYPFP
jgi:hypothetical protein